MSHSSSLGLRFTLTRPRSPRPTLSVGSGFRSPVETDDLVPGAPKHTPRPWTAGKPVSLANDEER